MSSLVEKTVLDLKRSMIGLHQGNRPRQSIRSVAIRSAAACVVTHARKQFDPVKVAGEIYGSGSHIESFTRAPGPWLTKAVTNPAMVSVNEWAGELVGSRVASLAAELAPQSAYSQLAARSMRLDMTGTGSMSLPYRATTTYASPKSFFRAEGSPLPVREVGFSSTILKPFNGGLISLYTAELGKRSTPTIESLLERHLAEDIGISVDSILLSDAAATPISPAGLFNGAEDVTAIGGSIEDISALAKAFAPAPSDFVLIANPGTALRIRLDLAATAAAALPIVTSDVMSSDQLAAIDASDLATASNDNVIFDTTEDATVINADPSLPVTDEDGVRGVPTNSTWQMNLVAVRLLENLTWGMRRPGRVKTMAIAW